MSTKHSCAASRRNKSYATLYALLSATLSSAFVVTTAILMVTGPNGFA